MSCATRLKCVASLVRTRSRQAAPGFVVGRLLAAAASGLLAGGAGSRRLRVLGFLAIVGCVSRGVPVSELTVLTSRLAAGRFSYAVETD